MRQQGYEAREVVIDAKNDGGIRVNGQWINFSRWAREIEECAAGDRVEIKVDRQGFIRELRVLERGRTDRERPGTAPGNNPSWLAVQALNAAIELLKISLEPTQSTDCEQNFETALELAERILEWLRNQ